MLIFTFIFLRDKLSERKSVPSTTYKIVPICILLLILSFLKMTLMYGVLSWVLYIKCINASNSSLLVLNHTYCCLCLIVIIFFSSTLFCTYVSTAILSRIFQNNVEHYITNWYYGKISIFLEFKIQRD